jgi:hypothetical protein
MSFASQPVSASGSENGDSVDVTCSQPLPNVISQIEQNVQWSINAAGEGFSSGIESTTHEVLVTFGNPMNTLSAIDSSANSKPQDYSITDKRLESAVAACDGLGANPSHYDVAAAIQNWLPGNAWWNTTASSADAPSTPDGYWRLIDGANTGVYSNCFQIASLEEMMLETLGIGAQREFIVATPESVLITGQASYGSSTHQLSVVANGQWPPVVGERALYLDFNGVPNEGEGAVRVGSCVYTEGAIAVGVDDVACLTDDPSIVCSAELDALVQLADLYGGRASFQQVVTFVASAGNSPPVPQLLPPNQQPANPLPSTEMP